MVLTNDLGGSLGLKREFGKKKERKEEGKVSLSRKSP